MNKDTISYKRGFAKGIEICNTNLKNEGYYADDNNKRAVNAFRHYAETGNKKGIPLNNGQIEYFYGMADGIEYHYKKQGTPLFDKKPLSGFQKYEQEHYYGKPNNHYDNIDDEIFG